ncbi:MAG: PH domain-containing protein, partial [Planctomycetes bacterium]|nr:PH domain-containing protein [Planctomycetota bacterium]
HRIFGLGDVEIATAGHSEVEIHMRGIRDPEGVKEAIRKLQGILTESDE